jgi:integrase
MSKLFRKAAKTPIPAGKRDVHVADDDLPGFYIRKYDTGKQSYVVKYSLPSGKQRKLSLGVAIPGIESEVRKQAAGILLKAKGGGDIVGEKRAMAAKRSIAVETLISKYLAERRNQVSDRHFIEIRRYLETYAKSLHALAIDEVTRKHVVRCVDEISEEKGESTADHWKRAISPFFSWCIERGFIDINPSSNIKQRCKRGSCDRVLSDEELAEIWHACGDGDYASIIRLLILTAQRKAEISELCWFEIDRDSAVIDLSAARTKNRRPHLVPLSAEALVVIDAIPVRLGRDLLFGEGVGGFSGWSRSKEALDRRINAARAKAGKEPLPPWTVHDIRRSVVTALNERGFAAPHIIEAVVNHASGHKAGVAGTYNRAAYATEKRKALDAWGAYFISKIVI